MPSHEKTFASPIGGNIMVGNKDETINRLAPLNMVGTTREALVTSVAYGQIDAAAGGKLKVGYHVGCAVTIGTGTLGATPDIVVPIPLNQDRGNLDRGNLDRENMDRENLDRVILLNPNPVVTINLTPGEVAEVPLAEKEMIPGKLIQTVVRDYHIKVNTCTGPVTLRQYTYVTATSPETDDMGAVFGDPTWL